MPYPLRYLSLVTKTFGQMSSYSVLYLATHAAFVTGKPEYSFIVFGNNESANFNDVQTWTLKNLDLVVLSACETRLGGKLDNGEEILVVNRLNYPYYWASLILIGNGFSWIIGDFKIWINL